MRTFSFCAVFISLLTYSFISSATTTTNYYGVEDKTWSTCGNCGDSGGDGYTATFKQTTGISSPSMDGQSAEFSISGTKPYANAYWYLKRLGVPGNYLQKATYDFYLYVPSSAATAYEAIEFEMEQCIGGKVYNMAWQANPGKGYWRVYDYTKRGTPYAWEPTSVAFKWFSTGTWHHIVSTYHTVSGYVYHDTLVIDGVSHSVGIKLPAVSTGCNSYLSNAFQLDMNGAATDYHVFVDKMKIQITY